MKEFDFMIAGSGFGGSLMAMILRRLGKTVVMLERGKHPRFAIGESSTPLANLLIEELAARYNLPQIAPFSKWGTWQTTHPKIACGLKRGFTFYQHRFDEPTDFADRTRQLLVAASPNNQIADTHWYRPDFDVHWASLAREAGADLIENASFTLRESAGWWKADGADAKARFLIDATGPRGCLFRHLGLREEITGFLRDFPETQTLYAHFRNVDRIDYTRADLPYPVDDAAVHHLFEGGWIWILRFNNGITSAGVAATKEFDLQNGNASWNRLLARIPSVQKLFASAEPITPFFHQRPLPFHARVAAGPNWALLPSAAGFVDPLFSTGFVLNLLGIARLAEAIEKQTSHHDYEHRTFEELNAAGQLVAAAYRTFGRFEEFAAVSRIYFAAAIWAETKRRLGHPAPGFLLSDDPKFSRQFYELCANTSAPDFAARASNFIEPYDLAGLTDPTRRNWHPALASDLLASAKKIGATPEELRAMLSRCGFK